jgi:uncharacterized protein (DUF433 family)
MERGNAMSTEYVQKQHDVYQITGTRVSLASIVYAWWAGQSAQTIAQSFPVLTLEQVYGAIAFYLAHREEIDRMDRANKRYFALAAPSSASFGVRQRASLEAPPHLGSARAVSAARQHVRERT